MLETVKQHFGLLLTAGMAYIVPIQGTMIAIGALIAIDLIFGVIGAYRQKETINSVRMADTLIKVFAYQLLLISSFITETHFISWVPIVSITAGFIGITELTSIGENFQKITGIPFIKYLKEQLTKYGKPKR